MSLPWVISSVPSWVLGGGVLADSVCGEGGTDSHGDAHPTSQHTDTIRGKGGNNCSARLEAGSDRTTHGQRGVKLTAPSDELLVQEEISLGSNGA